MGLLDDKYGLKPNIKILILSLTVIFLLITDQNLRITFLRFSFFNNMYDILELFNFLHNTCMLVLLMLLICTMEVTYKYHLYQL